jgi:hypothetical protein
MRENWIKYEDIEEKRDGYYVEYSPVFTGAEFAILRIHVYELALSSSIKSIAENELKVWALRYATPLMVMVSNKTQEEWGTKDIVGHSYLLGYAKGSRIVAHWDEYPDFEQPEIDLSKEQLAKIYSGLKYRTYDDVVVEQAKQVKDRRVLLLVMTFWFCMIPALIAYLGWSSPFFSLLALIYSWYLVAQKGLKLWGKKKKSEKEIAQEKEDLEKAHHHYHCKLNPNAFLQLKYENFKNDSLERERAKIESMSN